MKNKGDSAALNESLRWTRPDAYVDGLVRRRAERRRHILKPRTQPEAPNLLLSTLPFVVLLAALAVIAVGVMILAWPGQRTERRPQIAQHELGYADKGWFQEAEKQFK